MTDWSVFFTGAQLRNAIRAAAASDITDPLPAFPTATDVAVLVFFPGATGPAWLVATTTTSATAGFDIQVRAWADWLGTTTGPVLAGMNVSSVNRTSAGKYTVNFATGAGATNYGAAISVTQAEAAANLRFAGPMATGSQLATGFDVIVLTAGGNATDGTVVHGVWYW